jgi:hypothetical protein
MLHSSGDVNSTTVQACDSVGDVEGRLERTATLFGYLLFLVPASALKRAARLAERLALPLAIAALSSGLSTVFVCADCFLTSDLMTVLLILISSNAAFSDGFKRRLENGAVWLLRLN